MKKIVALAAASVVAIGASLSVTTQSQAFFFLPLAIGIGAATAAGVATAATVDAASGGGYALPPVYDPVQGHFAQTFGPLHFAECSKAYPSYDQSTDTYIAGWHHHHAVRASCTL
jgi:hypothetical protein